MMSLVKLSSLVTRSTSRTLFQRFITNQPKLSLSTKSQSSDDDVEDDNTPIRYSTSKAAQWTPEASQTGREHRAPKYQGDIVALSTGAFLLYFLWLREENDIDEAFSLELIDHFPGMDKEEFSKKFGVNIVTDNKQQ